MSRHVARKRFGQHFLNDPEIIDRIVSLIDPEPGAPIIEIGPGRGAITVPLLEHGTALTVVELDRDLLHGLERMHHRYPALTIINQDALELDLAAITKDKVRIVGNLPYNISSPLLFHLFTQQDRITDMIFMLQKEVVDRLCAVPNDSDYSRLSVMGQFYCDMERQFDVEPGAFSPPPRVMSSIVTLQPRCPDPDLDPDLFSKLVQQAFSQRRKMLRNNLSAWLEEADYAQLNLDPGQRAQELSVEDFKAMTRLIMARS